MGSRAPDARLNAQPQHEIRVRSFEMTASVATYGLMRACQDAGGCHFAPGANPIDDPGIPDQEPFGFASWGNARELAAWLGGCARLCTEAEWEYAARSGGRPGRFPWGSFPCPQEGETEQGATMYSYDLPVGEWVDDACRRDYGGTIGECIPAPQEQVSSNLPRADSSGASDDGQDPPKAFSSVMVRFGYSRVHDRSCNSMEATRAVRLCRSLPEGEVPDLPEPPPPRQNGCDGQERVELDDSPWYCELDWARIEGGTYSMGSGAREARTDESPVHEVAVHGFEIMRHQATYCLVRRCVNDGFCDPMTPEGLLPVYRANWQDLPMKLADFGLAAQFAEWAAQHPTGERARLCTEAEWEYAARSQGQDRRLPWGEAFHFDCRGGLGGIVGDLPSCAVCATPEMDTAQGVCDMAANGSDWVADHYHPSYVGAPVDGSAWAGEAGQDRVVRGGGTWGTEYQQDLEQGWSMRTTRRVPLPEDFYEETTIRLCRDVPAEQKVQRRP